MSYEIIRPIKKSDDLSLQVLGKLLVISPIKKDTGKKCIWLCVCHCGAVVSRTFNVLKRARRHTCGCLSGNVRHGATGTSEYQIWHSMKARCTNPLAANFQWYGGRGISVCESWLESFEAFHHDMGDRPPGRSLDRIDNNGPYSPENCRWASKETQNGNRRSNRILTYLGETHTLTEWARKLNILPDTLSYRINKGWTVERAFQAPIDTGRYHPTSRRKKCHIDSCQGH